MPAPVSKASRLVLANLLAWVRNDRSAVDVFGQYTQTGVDGNGDPVYQKNEDLNVNTLDVRYAGIPLWQDGSLEVGPCMPWSMRPTPRKI